MIILQVNPPSLYHQIHKPFQNVGFRLYLPVGILMTSFKTLAPYKHKWRHFSLYLPEFRVFWALTISFCLGFFCRCTRNVFLIMNIMVITRYMVIKYQFSSMTSPTDIEAISILNWNTLDMFWSLGNRLQKVTRLYWQWQHSQQMHLSWLFKEAFIY